MKREYKKLVAKVIEKNLSEGKIIKGKLFGKSMVPCILPNQYIYIKKFDKYKINDIVAFNTECNGFFIVHRIIEKNDSNFKIKGDNDTNIKLVKRSEIVGKVISIEKEKNTYN